MGVVIGSGPNSLTAAALLARAGHHISVWEAQPSLGGGCRSYLNDEYGTVHDHCSSVHPLGAVSPAFKSLDLTSHGVQWLHPPIALAHPFDDGSCAVLDPDTQLMADYMPEGYASWERLFAPATRQIEAVVDAFIGPLHRVVKFPMVAATVGTRAALSASVAAASLHGEASKALLMGIAAHSFSPLTRPGSAAVAMVLGGLGATRGWPVARGGSQAITNALLSVLSAYGGEYDTGRAFPRFAADHRFSAADPVMLGTSAREAAHILGDHLPAVRRRQYSRFRHGPSAFVVDMVLDEEIPWTAAAARQAGTVHVGGSAQEIIAAQQMINRDVMPPRPFVLVSQQYVADRSRAHGEHVPVLAYGHVPHGFTGDARDHIVSQIERFAPGFSSRILSLGVRSPAQIYAENRNFVGGDIATGATDMRQLVARPSVVHPYRTGVAGVYLCSAATAPGGGVHGMSGLYAAQDFLARCAS